MILAYTQPRKLIGKDGIINKFQIKYDITICNYADNNIIKGTKKKLISVGNTDYNNEINVLLFLKNNPGLLCSCSKLDKKIRIWDIEKGKEVFTFTDAHDNEIYHLIEIQHNHKYKGCIASCSKDKKIKFWDIKKKKLVKTLKEPDLEDKKRLMLMHFMSPNLFPKPYHIIELLNGKILSGYKGLRIFNIDTNIIESSIMVNKDFTFDNFYINDNKLFASTQFYPVSAIYSFDLNKDLVNFDITKFEFNRLSEKKKKRKNKKQVSYLIPNTNGQTIFNQVHIPRYNKHQNIGLIFTRENKSFKFINNNLNNIFYHRNKYLDNQIINGFFEDLNGNIVYSNNEDKKLSILKIKKKGTEIIREIKTDTKIRKIVTYLPQWNVKKHNIFSKNFKEMIMFLLHLNRLETNIFFKISKDVLLYELFSLFNNEYWI